MIKFSIIIPVYNSEEILSDLVQQIFISMKGYRNRFEVILICDHSTDNSWNIIKSLSKKYKNITGILLQINAGQHNACMAGFAAARGDFIITMDDDLQHSPFDIPLLYDEIIKGYDVVYTNFKNREHPFWKIFSSSFNNFTSSLLIGKPRNLYLSPFRIFTSQVKNQILNYSGPYVYVDGLILSVTRNISSIIVNHHPRFKGKSSYGFFKSISLWSKMATGFSITPLRLTSFIGIFVASSGFLLALIFIIQKFTIDFMPLGWTSVIVTLLTIGGFQLIAIGVIGEYLGRVLMTLNGKPQYIIKEKIQSSN